MTKNFQDPDVLFPEKVSGKGVRIPYPKQEKRKATQKRSSAPMNVRELEFSGSSWIRHYAQSHSFEEDEEMVPPHVILERRITGKAAFSLCLGNGRTLKGRDLSQVRNSVLRMTGFLES